MLRKHLLLAIVVFLAVFGVNAYRTFSATPLYTTSATLRIEPQNPTVMKIEEVLSSQTGGSNDYYPTVLALLKSRTLTARIITDLGLEWNPAFTGTRESKPGLLGWLRTQTSGLLQSSLSSISNLFGANPSSTPEEEPPPLQEHDLGVPSGLIDRYLGLLRVMPVINTRLVRVELTSPDPNLSRDIANAHATAFIRMNLETRFELTKEAREFLEKKLSELKAKVEHAEVALNRFRQEHGIVSLEGEENIIASRMVELHRRLTVARAERIEAEAHYRVIENRDSGSLTQVIDNSLIQELRTQSSTLEAEYAQLSYNFKPNHPTLVRLSQQIDETRRRLDREIVKIVRGIETNYEAARAREEALQSEAERQQQAVLQLKQSGVEYTILAQEVASGRTLYNNVLTRSNETNVAGDIAISNIQITDRAETPLAPSLPKTRRDLLMGAAMGLALGVGLALFLEYIDSTMKTPQDVWRAVATPTLGTVPELTSLRKIYYYGNGKPPKPNRQIVPAQEATDHSFPRELVVSHHPFSVVSESYRTIRTALLLSQAGKPPQVILLTSPQPNDGKTVTTLNLAIAFAQDGHSVLVIDADLRKGSCHTLVHLQNHRGLSNVLSGNLSLQDGLQQTAVERLWLLSCGVTPPNPVELLGSKKMQAVLDDLRQNFDFILVDTPPAIVVSDAVVLSALCDGVLLVLRGQRTTTAAARRVMERLHAVSARILGVVLNGIDMRSPDYADYRYYYSFYYTTAGKEAEKHDS